MSNLKKPFRPYHPGELLKDELEYRQIQQKTFAEKIGVSYTVVNEILNAKRPVSTDFALLMEAALGVNADLLVRLQGSYNMQVMRADHEKQKRWNEIRKNCAAFF